MGWTLYHYEKACQRDQYWMLLDEEGKAVIYSPRPGVLMTEFAREAHAFAWFRPSENIGQAWEVVEKLRERGIRLALVQTDEGWLVGRYDDTGCVQEWVVDIKFSVYAECESAPLAICRCALAAIDYDDNFGDTYSEAER